MKEKTLDEEYYEAISGIPDKIMGIKEKIQAGIDIKH